MLVYGDKDIVIIEKKCPFCKETTTVIIPTEKYIKLQEGELIQNAMPGLTAVSRETLISGICCDCQDKIFGTEEDE